MEKLKILLPLVLLILLVVAIIVATVTAFVMYGDKPITEIPAWALIFMFGGKK